MRGATSRLGRLSPTASTPRYGLGLALLLHLAAVGLGVSFIRRSALLDMPRADPVTMVFATPGAPPQPVTSSTGAEQAEQQRSSPISPPVNQPVDPTPAAPQTPPATQEAPTSSPPTQPEAGPANPPPSVEPASPPPSVPETKVENAPRPMIQHAMPQRPLTRPRMKIAATSAKAAAAPQVESKESSAGTKLPESNSAVSTAQQAAAPTPGWRSALAAWLASHKTYPMAARQHGDEGTVIIRFSVDHSGRVTAVSIVRGSGVPTLDQAAEDMLRDATLPAPTGDTTVSVQLRYSLSE